MRSSSARSRAARARSRQLQRARRRGGCSCRCASRARSPSSLRARSVAARRGAAPRTISDSSSSARQPRCRSIISARPRASHRAHGAAHAARPATVLAGAALEFPEVMRARRARDADRRRWADHGEIRRASRSRPARLKQRAQGPQRLRARDRRHRSKASGRGSGGLISWSGLKFVPRAVDKRRRGAEAPEMRYDRRTINGQGFQAHGYRRHAAHRSAPSRRRAKAQSRGAPSDAAASSDTVNITQSGAADEQARGARAAHARRRRGARRCDQGRHRLRHLRDRRSDASPTNCSSSSASCSAEPPQPMNSDSNVSAQSSIEQIRCAEAMLETLTSRESGTRRRRSRTRLEPRPMPRPSSSTRSRRSSPSGGERAIGMMRGERARSGHRRGRAARADRGMQGAESAQRHAAESAQPRTCGSRSRRCAARSRSSTAPAAEHRRAPTRGRSARRK